MIGGALASAMSGEPRATEDIDMVADLGPDQTEAFITALGDDFSTIGVADLLERALRQAGLA